MNRDDYLIQLRPEIPSALVNENMSPLEQFQNATLRPILKFQNSVLTDYYRQFATSYNKNWGSLSNEKKEAFIETSLLKNQSLRNAVLGMITGFFTSTEYPFYLAHKSQVNRRIIQLSKQRILSNLSNL